ncbi:MAG TPA: hypothetical protein VFC90_03960 [Planctomycetota bacterium]|nr:hypothetical protein [Planctomycetota bacterium]
MKLDTALYQMRSQPLAFLRHNLLTIAGASQSGARAFYLGYGNISLTPTTNEWFKFSHDRMVVASTTTGLDGKNTVDVQVHNVRMIPSGETVDLADIEPYALGGGGPDLMVTGQLSGCVLAIQKVSGGLIVAHIQPGGTRGPGPTLCTQIKNTGKFRGHGSVTHAFGIGAGYSTRAHVIGVRKGGAWNLYAQQVSSGSGPVTGSVQIV